MINDKICDGCNNHEIKLHNCEMCKKDFCINCMHLFCAECKEYYSCFWCGSKFKVTDGIENVNNESFRCKKHQIELPKFKIQYRHYTKFEEEKQQSKNTTYYKHGTPQVIITKTADLKWVLPEYKTEIEEIKEIDNAVKKRFIMKTFVKIDGDWNLIKEEFVTDTTIDIKFE